MGSTPLKWESLKGSGAAKLAVKILEGSKSIGIEPFNQNPNSDVGRIPTVKLKIPEKAI